MGNYKSKSVNKIRVVTPVVVEIKLEDYRLSDEDYIKNGCRN